MFHIQLDTSYVKLDAVYCFCVAVQLRNESLRAELLDRELTTARQAAEVAVAEAHELRKVLLTWMEANRKCGRLAADYEYNMCEAHLAYTCCC